MSFWRWTTTVLRQFDYNLSPPATILRLPSLLSGVSLRWAPRNLLAWWPDLNFSFVDDVVWSLVTAVESVALVSMLCFFFVFCGCTI